MAETLCDIQDPQDYRRQLDSCRGVLRRLALHVSNELGKQTPQRGPRVKAVEASYEKVS